MGPARGAPAPVPPVGRLIVRAVMVVWSEDFTDRMPFLKDFVFYGMVICVVYIIGEV